jgi:hypothetical protein
VRPGGSRGDILVESGQRRLKPRANLHDTNTRSVSLIWPYLPMLHLRRMMP